MHTTYDKGTPLHIILKSGQILTGKFKDHKSGKVILEDNKIIKLTEVRSISPRKLKTEVTSSKIKVKFRTDK